MTSFQKIRKIHPLSIASLPHFLWGVFGIFFLLALLSPNPGIGLLGIILAIGISLMLWRPAQPQTLLFIVGFQWLQGFAPILLALYEGQTIAAMMGGEEFERSTVLTLLAVTVFALGLKVGTPCATSSENTLFIEGWKQLNGPRLLVAWGVLCIVCMGLTLLRDMFPGLKQLILPITLWKWAVVFLLFLYWLANRKGGFAVALVLITETVAGFMGYFSAFKEVFFILILAGSSIVGMNNRRVGIFIFVGILVMIVFGFWQAVKGTYRDFLNQGERAQVVRVSISDRLAWLARAIVEVEGNQISKGWEEGLRRLSYVEYFGYSLMEVPHRIPHTQGKLWKEALLHPLMPRLFFHQKLMINDSDRTNTYATKVTRGEEGTSIGIGYIGESYIDFGSWGMFLPIFLWGWLMSLSFNTVRKCAPHPLLGIALGSCLLLSIEPRLESSNIKMMGGLVAGFLVTLVLMCFFGKKLWKWVTTIHSSNLGSNVFLQKQYLISQPSHDTDSNGAFTGKTL